MPDYSCNGRLGAALAAMALALLTFAAPDVANASWTKTLELDDLRGCFAVSDKNRMACVNLARGRAQLELRGITSTRIYRLELLGTEEAPLEVAKTPKKTLRKIRRLLRERGFQPVPEVKPQEGRYPVPGSPCELHLPAGKRYLYTVGGGKDRPWLALSGPRGEVSIVAVHHDAAGARYFFTLDYLTDGDIRSRQVEVVATAQVAERKECAAP